MKMEIKSTITLNQNMIFQKMEKVNQMYLIECLLFLMKEMEIINLSKELNELLIQNFKVLSLNHKILWKASAVFLISLMNK